VQKRAPQEAAAPLSTTRTLLHDYADIIQIHVSQVPVPVLMIVEVHADRLPLGKWLDRTSPVSILECLRDLHDLCQRGAGAVLNLRLLTVVGDRVPRRGPVPEGESRLGGSTGNGDRLVQRRIAVGFAELAPN
jgi:hypothetical protein